MKCFIKKYKKYLIVFCLILFMSFFFPFSGDDFYWGCKSISLNEYVNIYNDLFLNGRWLGNTLAILISRSHIVKALFISFVLSLLFYVIDKHERINVYLFFILIILMPIVRFSQSIVWGSGFVNYGTSCLLYLSIYYLIKKYYYSDSKLYIKVLLMLGCLFSSLILENITIAIDIMLFVSNIVYYRKNKKVNKTLFWMFVGSLIGSICMFIHPSYLNIVNNNSVNERYFPSNGYYYMYVIRSNLSLIFYCLLFDKVFVNFVFLIILIYLLFKNKISIKLFMLYVFTFIVGLVCTVFELGDWVKIGCGVIYLINIIYILYKLVGFDRKIAEYIGLIFLNVIPILLVKPIGERLFFLSYVLELLILFRVIDILKIEFKCNYVLKIVLLLLYIVYSFIYISSYKYEVDRDNYIRENQDKIFLELDKAPFEEFVWWYFINDDFANKYYNMYYGYSNIMYFER